MTTFYEIPSLPESLRPNWLESELSFIAPLPRKNYVVNPSFEVDRVGETKPYNWDVGTYTYSTNTLSSSTDIGSVVSENVYSGFNAMRCNFGDDTSISFLYGRTQPILLPLNAKKNSFFSTNQNKTLYRVSGALSFYAYAPIIDAYTAFSLFDQSLGVSRNFVTRVYATVDANGEPNGDFNSQRIIAESTVSIAATQSSFYSEDVEPNYIGRRKNPEWIRYVVPFSTIFDYQKDNFIRFSIATTAPAVGASTNFLFYLDAVQVEFFDDDFPFYTTYLDGDLGKHDPLHPPGYYWEGANQKSISVRTIEAYSGGVLFNFQKDFMINVVNIRGMGLPTPSNNVTPYEYADGQQYVSTGIDSRKISITGYVSGDTALESNRATGILQYLLSKERSGVSNQRRFYYRIPESICNDPGSQYVFFDAVVESIKPDPESNSPRFSLVIELNNINIYYYTNNNVFYNQSALQPNIKFENTYGVKLFRAQGAAATTDVTTKQTSQGSATSLSYFGYENYDLYVNGSILCWCELSNGCILFGGKFTNVSYSINGKKYGVQCNNIGLISTNGVVYPIGAEEYYEGVDSIIYKKYNGVQTKNIDTFDYALNNVTSNTIVRSIIQTDANTIMIGGNFNVAVGRTTECNNIWHVTEINEIGTVIGPNLDIEGGLVSTANDGGVYTLLYVPKNNAVYVGGLFSSSVNTNNGVVKTLTNAAIYYFDRDYKWESMWYGTNGTVTTMTFFQDRYVVAGGLFTAWRSSDSLKPLLTNTKYAAVYDTAKSTANNARLKSLSSVNAITTTASLPASGNAVFDAQVNKMITDNFGNVIIGGRFTTVDMNNDSHLPFQQLSVNRIVRWDGFDRYTLMENGISNTVMSYWGNPTGTISTSTASTAITGVNTNFSEADIGNKLYTTAGVLLGTIASVTSATTANFSANAGATLASQSYLYLKYYMPNLLSPLSYQITQINDICISPYNNDVYAVGSFSNIGNIQQSFGIARWATNRWESLDFELQSASISSVFISKRGYGFISYKKSNNYLVTSNNGRTTTTRYWSLNNISEPNLIVIDNYGLETQPVIELSNPKNNQQECDVISIYNLTNHKSMTFNMKVFVGETITIDFSEPNIQPKSNVRDRIVNSLVGGGTFANFFLSEGKNVIKILGGQRGVGTGEFSRPLEVKIRYHTRQISPYVVVENDIISRDEPLIGWTLNKSKLGLDTVAVQTFSIASNFTLEQTIWSKDSVVKT